MSFSEKFKLSNREVPLLQSQTTLGTSGEQVELDEYCEIEKNVDLLEENVNKISQLITQVQTTLETSVQVEKLHWKRVEKLEHYIRYEWLKESGQDVNFD